MTTEPRSPRSGDKADGIELGVEATPTFFLNDDKVDVSSLAELVALIDVALAA